MARQWYPLFYLFFVGLVWTKDIDFGDPATCTLDSNKECLVDLKVDCTQQQDLSGFILSPNFPATMTSEQAGKYQATISSCPNSQISLTLTDENFNLATQNNKFYVGNGLVLESNKIPPELNGNGNENELPGGLPTYPYQSSANSLWMVVSVPEYRSMFKIQYNIILLSSNVHYYNESSGNMISPGYGTSYPSEATEDIHVIDVTSVAGDYVDLLLTVNVLDIKGINGDYIKLGPGSDYLVQTNAALLSWQINTGVQFLIDGPRAHLVFYVSKAVEGDQQPSAKGFFISYQVIEKNLTTPAPSTTPLPTSPTPLPFDPDILLTDIVFHEYVGATAALQLADILQKYAQSSGMLEEGEIFPSLSQPGTVDIVEVENCYHGWNVDISVCGLTHVIVRAFYQKTDENTISYAFPTDKTKAAVKEYGHIHQIVLPEDLLDMYWITVGSLVILIVVIILALLIFWRQKIRREATKRSKYHEIGSTNTSSSTESGIAIKGVGASMSFETYSGKDNPNFIVDEEENGKPVLVYDPEKANFYSRSNYKPTSHAKELDSEPARTAAVLNVSPITSNFQRQAALSSHAKNAGEDMSSIMPPLVATVKRGILKTNSVSSPTILEFPSSFGVPVEEMEDVVLYDNKTLKTMQQRRYSPATSSSSGTIISSSQSSRGNSISTDEQIGSHVLYGITLDQPHSDGENETNL